MTPGELYTYAVQFCHDAEATGQGSKYPTFRQVATRFNVTYEQILQACDNWQGDACMAPAVGLRSGDGVATFSARGEHMFEAYR